MERRRVVTGVSAEGKAVFVSDGPAPRSVDLGSIPGMTVTLAWSTDAGDRIPADGADPTPDTASFHPGPGCTRLLVMQFPPDSVYTTDAYDAAAAPADSEAAFPGLAELFEAEAPGMHTTESIDYGIVLDGEPVLELDDGAARELRPGDVVIQNGTRHAWRNPTARPTTVAFVLVGAQR
jgi:hypothetical protein